MTVKPELRRPAWSYLGVDVEGLSLEEAMTVSGIDFPVVAHPAQVVIPEDDDGNYKVVPVEGAQTIYRPDNECVLAQVGHRYRVVQTREVIHLVEELVGGGWEPLYGGQLRRGRQVFLVGRLPFKSDHDISPYLAFVNSFDGTTGVRLAMTPIRARCMNAVRRTFRSATASVSLRHTESLRMGNESIREALGIAKQYYRRLDEDIERLLTVGLEGRRLEEAMDLLYPTHPLMTETQIERREAKQWAIKTNLWDSPTIPSEYRETAWGLWNAVSEVEQWGRQVTDKNRATLLGAQMGTNTITLQSDRLYRLVDSWA